MMGDLKHSNELTDAALIAALERVPEVMVPAYFAARVRAALPARQAAKARRPVARVVGVAAVVMLAIALFVLAPRTPASVLSVGFYVELLLIAEMGAAAYWLASPSRFLD